MKTKALAELAENAEENVSNQCLVPWSVVKVGLCARDSREGSPARPGQGPSQNDLRLRAK